MIKRNILKALLVLLFIISFLPHTGIGEAKKFSIATKNYWQLMTSPAYLFLFIVLMVLVATTLFFAFKKESRKSVFFTSLSVTAHIVILLSVISPFFRFLYQRNLFSSLFGQSGVLSMMFTYSWGLLIDLILSVCLLGVLIKKTP
ncbi:hypothetical protein [Oenococcus oeni]|uniref:Uncharacterized protein n=9 Tax=Oenococcus oeni TaxID=1247 RepID=Q04FY1_OENOB|nr:hypothetical protein [Oenococcus oeni]KGO16628.1 hypothetical protein OA32_03445 [Oenococcus oeni X2L]ABJ56641.1 hypothetical protein OEOE_0707 [Oenococcus oeni PSU-1]AWW98202.1 hypothetical protein C5H79_01085 [Oenococcus oeni]EFD88777.1 hypothetical protein AWRIB429_0659 [Oenococcus oeni AWRIB429]EJO00094.1 hypothetical protein AWRIB418_1303 [Oenococcus oeni AWRIB418]